MNPFNETQRIKTERIYLLNQPKSLPYSISCIETVIVIVIISIVIISIVAICKGDCGAELNQILAGGPKLIYYNNEFTRCDLPSRRS